MLALLTDYALSMTNRPMWTLTEAVQNTTASRSTIRRYHEAGRFPGAYKDSKNQWRFPMEDLLAAGIELRRASPTEQAQDAQPEQATPAQPAAVAAGAPDPELIEKLHRMEIELAVERQKVEGLQKLVDAAETGRSDLRRALLVLEAPKPAEPAPQPVVQPEQPSQPFALGPGPAVTGTRYAQPERKGWFRRFIEGE